jgi:hypothetical protein
MMKGLMLMFILATAETPLMSFDNIAGTLISIAAVLGAIGVIINSITSIKSKNKKFVSNIVSESLKQYDTEANMKIERSVIEYHNKASNKIDVIENKLDQFMKEERCNKENKDKELDKVLKLLKDANIEVYKNAIRKVYYRLRETGEITDYQKEYVDALFPLYRDLGGNSDIESKYKEICDFYNKVTRENIEKARRNKRLKKEVDEANAEEKP